MPVRPASSLVPLTGSLAQSQDPRVPTPQTTSAMLPSQQAANFTNQRLGGLISGTSSTVQAPISTAFNSMRMPSQVGQQAANPIGDSIRAANANLSQIAQARRQAMVRALNNQGGSSGSSGPVAPSAPYKGGPVSFEGYTGGATFARLIPLLKGYQVTDTYRDPEYNRRVGGVSTSYHMDKNNPAVDIGGSTAQLNALYAKLKAMGGWRQLLWQVPGHYDHIHVA